MSPLLLLLRRARELLVERGRPTTLFPRSSTSFNSSHRILIQSWGGRDSNMTTARRLSTIIVLVTVLLATTTTITQVKCDSTIVGHILKEGTPLLNYPSIGQVMDKLRLGAQVNVHCRRFQSGGKVFDDYWWLLVTKPTFPSLTGWVADYWVRCDGMGTGNCIVRLC